MLLYCTLISGDIHTPKLCPLVSLAATVALDSPVTGSCVIFFTNAEKEDDDQTD